MILFPYRAQICLHQRPMLTIAISLLCLTLNFVARLWEKLALAKK